MVAAKGEEKAQKVAESMNKTFVQAAETQSTLAIGEAVVALVTEGSALTVETIIAHLQAQAATKPTLVLQARNAAAERELLVAQTKNQSQ